MDFNPEKLKENVAEYILYMYQIEDLVRAYDLNIDLIMTNFVNLQIEDETKAEESKVWFTEVVKQMIFQRIEKTGHLQEITELLIELSYLHNILMNVSQDERYRKLFEIALPFINEFKERSNVKDKNEIEVSFHALYMKLLLKLQRKEISKESEEAFDAMRNILAYLSTAYAKMKSGQLDFLNN
ncbi:MAG: DUF4924 family protein [Bacteroidota bacterium]